jgi:hypothetical protein
LPRTQVSQTLAFLAANHPNLRKLTIQFPDFNHELGDRDSMKRRGNDWDNFAGTLPLLRQLECLRLLEVQFLRWDNGDKYNYILYRGDVEETDDSTPNLFQGMQLKVPLSPLNSLIPHDLLAGGGNFYFYFANLASVIWHLSSQILKTIFSIQGKR